MRQGEKLMEAERRSKEQAAQELRHRAEEDQRRAAVRLEAWRSQRQLQEKQDEERRLKEEVFQKRRRREELRRQKEVRLAVKACVQQKREQEEQRLAEKQAMEQAEMEERRRAAAQIIQCFQERVSNLLSSSCYCVKFYLPGFFMCNLLHQKIDLTLKSAEGLHMDVWCYVVY